MANLILKKAPLPVLPMTTSQGVNKRLTRFSRDRMAMLPRNNVADAANLALFPVQDLPPEEAVLGVAVLFTALSRSLGLDASELHGMACMVLDFDDEGDHVTGNSLQVIRDLAATQFDGRDVNVT